MGDNVEMVGVNSKDLHKWTNCRSWLDPCFSSTIWSFITAKHQTNSCVLAVCKTIWVECVVVDCRLGNISLYKVEGVWPQMAPNFPLNVRSDLECILGVPGFFGASIGSLRKHPSVGRCRG